ncbi:MAG: capsule assembly Wzi family protein, partial [Fidelibacterota bacterium]
MIDDLKVRGYFKDLYPSNRPYTRGEIAASLLVIEKEISLGIRSPLPSEKWRLDWLGEEFKEEISWLAPDFYSDLKEFSKIWGLSEYINILDERKHSSTPGKERLKSSWNDMMHLGMLIEEDFRDVKEKSASRVRLRTKGGISVGKSIYIYNSMRVDQNLADDPYYKGRIAGSLGAFTEQAYLNYSSKYMKVKIGRDFIRWGPGKNGTLLISDNSRPLDHFSFGFQVGFFRFTSIIASLDPLDYSVEGEGILPDGRILTANRFLTAHRADFKFMGKLFVGISETALYGGVNRNFELPYLNPFIFLHGVQLNDEGRAANTLGSVDISFYPLPGYYFYIELMIDDIQLEKETPGDLEPNEIGVMIGTRLADPFGLEKADLNFEYARLTNRTYKTPTPYELFVHRNRPIGYYLGSDLDHTWLSFSYLLNRSLLFSTDFSYTRKGEGEIFVP